MVIILGYHIFKFEIYQIDISSCLNIAQDISHHTIGDLLVSILLVLLQVLGFLLDSNILYIRWLDISFPG